jgi:hypothetical protein
MLWEQNFQRTVETLADRAGNCNANIDHSLASELEETAEARFLVLGGKAPVIPGEAFSEDPATPCAAILLMQRVDAAVLAAALAEAPDPAVPIADFGANPMLRHDFSRANFNAGTFGEMKQAFAPIWRRLVELPFRAEREDRAELATLRLAYSREAPIEGVLTPETRNVVEYPLLGVGAGARRQLELLADIGVLRQRYFTRTHGCGKCGSARLNVFEACPSCGGADIVEEEIVHHYRCGAQEGQSRFAQGDLLVCPKCRRVLRHFGKDYDKPGVLITCRSCGASNSQPLVRFACLDCKAVTAADDAATTDWRHYDLTNEGIRTLREGRLPRFEIAAAFEKRTRAFSPQEFRLLMTQEMRSMERYKRPFALARISFPNLEALRHDIGVMAANAAFLVAVDAIADVLRSADFVGVRGPTSAMIAFPETSAAEVREGIAGRIRETIHKTTDVPIELAIAVAETGGIASMLVES